VKAWHSVDITRGC